MKTKVIIMRGLPGSGKTTHLKMLDEMSDVGNIIVSTDKFTGLYDSNGVFHPELLSAAHDYCFATFSRACALTTAGEMEPRFIAVDNTNITLAEINPYRMVARRHGLPVEFHVFEPEYNRATLEKLFHRNKHGVPFLTIERMAARWEFEPKHWKSEDEIVKLKTS